MLNWRITITETRNSNCRSRLSILIIMLRQAKVYQYRDNIPCIWVYFQHHIIWLDIQMCHSVLMQITYSLHDWHHDVQCLLLRQSTMLVYIISQAARIQIFHHIINRVVCLKHLIHMNDIWMFQADFIETLSFSQEILTAFLDFILDRRRIADAIMFVSLASFTHKKLFDSKVSSYRDIINFQVCGDLVGYAKTSLSQHLLYGIGSLRTMEFCSYW